ncbi:hypothetical protein K435DRAFT_361959 [Dendrothele bispora CBS 962.96]|uniref:Uncharacterized protein n=1 Tax=Dendrothele bispora (strain CBS 962.96) TaxID=1314807 RepID=A0A4S8MHT9_DENBC|nr:hypothetical protein K435DRAFT_361959 [Dendrothele bispora CBS 962.96]
MTTWTCVINYPSLDYRMPPSVQSQPWRRVNPLSMNVSNAFLNSLSSNNTRLPLASSSTTRRSNGYATTSSTSLFRSTRPRVSKCRVVIQQEPSRTPRRCSSVRNKNSSHRNLQNIGRRDGSRYEILKPMFNLLRPIDFLLAFRG